MKIGTIIETVANSVEPRESFAMATLARAGDVVCTIALSLSPTLRAGDSVVIELRESGWTFRHGAERAHARLNVIAYAMDGEGRDTWPAVRRTT